MWAPADLPDFFLRAVVLGSLTETAALASGSAAADEVWSSPAVTFAVGLLQPKTKNTPISAVIHGQNRRSGKGRQVITISGSDMHYGCDAIVVQSHAALQSIDVQIVESFSWPRFEWVRGLDSGEDSMIARELRPVHLQTETFPIIPNRQSQSVFSGCGELFARLNASNGRSGVYLVRRVAGFVTPALVFGTLVERADRIRIDRRD
jgi:hypothetical protein